MRRHRLYFLITDLDWGGAEKNLVQVATRLPRDRFEPPGVGCLFAPHRAAEVLRDAGLRVDCFGLEGWRDLGRIAAIARRLRDGHFDLLHTWLFHANIAGRFAAFAAGTRRVVSSVRVAEQRSWHLWADGLTQGLVDRASGVGEAVCRHTARYARVSPRKLFSLPIGIDPEAYPDATDPGAASPCRILGVGRLHPQKRWEDLVDALAGLAAGSYQARIVGEGPARAEIEARAAAAGVASHLGLPGRIDPIGPAYQAADLLVLPSGWEGMPNVVLEAMAWGLPVVATAVGATAELVVHGETGLLVRPGDVEGLTRTIARLVADPALRRRFGAAGRARALTTFTTDRMVARAVGVYTELLSG